MVRAQQLCGSGARVCVALRLSLPRGAMNDRQGTFLTGCSSASGLSPCRRALQPGSPPAGARRATGISPAGARLTAVSTASRTHGGTPDVSAGASQSTLLLQRNTELNQINQQLDQQKRNFAERMSRSHEQEMNLAAKQEAIKEQVRKFDKFIKENDTKRMRANKRASEEVKLRDKKEVERQQLIADLARYSQKLGEKQQARPSRAPAAPPPPALRAALLPPLRDAARCARRSASAR